MFVRNDKDHTVWSTPTYMDAQTHFLTINSASRSTDYHCLLIGITGRIIDSAEQHVYVKEPGEEYLHSYCIMIVALHNCV